MAKVNVTKFIQNTWTALSKHSPEILTGIGIAGMITTTVLAVKATPKALELIEEKKKELFKIDADSYEDCELTAVDTIKVAWKPYIPSIVTGVCSMACLIGASSVSSRRNAALATAYQLSRTALSDYKDKVVETIGEEKEKIIKDKIAEDKVKSKPAKNSEIILTEKGNTLCFDAISGRYFKSDPEQIRKVENIINRRLLHESYVSLNEFYDELGLKHTDIGKDLGWSSEDGYLELYLSPILAEDDRPCLAIEYSLAPRYNYYKFV